ncbi:TRAP transporter small permease subunit [Limnochorda pilosa]|uniref:Tripartite ATP-independent periplasmic transporters DctQ component domain-containing protein n=1 Tax=Limnochorda pilosa TaxID=1555112 RepID=A0A0K2SLD5_LIMPI|nr:TRAP transporter small permease [Limnochorda pilosa]BAS27936.1 hypothetical protein LIP_2095 [Limnochorda pilosa]
MNLWLDRTIEAARRLSRFAVWVCGVALFGTAGLIGVEVLVRKLFRISTQGATEISGYVLAACTAWALADALLAKSHVRVDLVLRRVGRRTRAFLDLVALLMLALFVAPLAHFAFRVVTLSVTRGATANTTLATPLWIPQGIWTVGIVWFLLIIVLLILRVAIAIGRGDHEAAARVAGIASLDDEE